MHRTEYDQIWLVDCLWEVKRWYIYTFEINRKIKNIKVQIKNIICIRRKHDKKTWAQVRRVKNSYIFVCHVCFSPFVVCMCISIMNIFSILLNCLVIIVCSIRTCEYDYMPKGIHFWTFFHLWSIISLFKSCLSHCNTDCFGSAEYVFFFLYAAYLAQQF